MKRTLILSLAGVAGFVASCTFGPMWTTPEMPVPAEFRGNGLAGSTMADLPWQQVLDDAPQEFLEHPSIRKFLKMAHENTDQYGLAGVVEN